jgi:hypothetical protein
VVPKVYLFKHRKRSKERRPVLRKKEAMCGGNNGQLFLQLLFKVKTGAEHSILDTTHLTQKSLAKHHMG